METQQKYFQVMMETSEETEREWLERELGLLIERTLKMEKELDLALDMEK